MAAAAVILEAAVEGEQDRLVLQPVRQLAATAAAEEPVWFLLFHTRVVEAVVAIMATLAGLVGAGAAEMAVALLLTRRAGTRIPAEGAAEEAGLLDLSQPGQAAAELSSSAGTPRWHKSRSHLDWHPRGQRLAQTRC